MDLIIKKEVCDNTKLIDSVSNVLKKKKKLLRYSVKDLWYFSFSLRVLSIILTLKNDWIAALILYFISYRYTYDPLNYIANEMIYDTIFYMSNVDAINLPKNAEISQSRST